MATSAVCLPPNPPPKSGTTTRTRPRGRPSAAATSARTANGRWVPTHTVGASAETRPAPPGSPTARGPCTRPCTSRRAISVRGGRGVDVAGLALHRAAPPSRSTGCSRRYSSSSTSAAGRHRPTPPAHRRAPGRGRARRRHHADEIAVVPPRSRPARSRAAAVVSTAVSDGAVGRRPQYPAVQQAGPRDVGREALGPGHRARRVRRAAWASSTAARSGAAPTGRPGRPRSCGGPPRPARRSDARPRAGVAYLPAASLSPAGGDLPRCAAASSQFAGGRRGRPGAAPCPASGMDRLPKVPRS